MRKYILFAICLIFLITALKAQETPLWMRYAAISPDGSQVVFSYKGDLYKVSSTGGDAIPLTLHEARDFNPVWSHDGKQIAFASNRYGNFDVFVIPASGGKATRLTHHSAWDMPSDFSKDNKTVLFTSSRLDEAKNQQFPSSVLAELYEVPIDGGRVNQVLTTPAHDAKYSPDFSKIIFHDRKGYENDFRKHHTSSVTRDIWIYDLEKKNYEQIESFNGEDRNPIFSSDGKSYYFLSEQNGSFNIFKNEIGKSTASKQISFMEKHPIRSLSKSNDGKLCFSFHGEIYTMKEGGKAEKININISADERYNEEKIKPISGGLSDMAVSPNGKEVAFISRGEVFVASVKEGTTKRISNTPNQERSVSFSPDGRSLLYASERNGSWNVYQSKIKRAEEKYFFTSTLIEEEVVIASDAQTFQPAYSPDGKEVAFLEERTALKVINLSSKKVREIMPKNKSYSYSDGDQHYEWSPDGKWFFVNFLRDKQWIDQAGLVSSSGSGEITNMCNSGYGSYGPRWMMNGEMMLWFSDKDGMKNHASWGGEIDVYGMFLTQDAYDKFTLNEEEYNLLKDEEKEDKKEEDKKKKDDSGKKDKDDTADKKVEPIKIELEDREDRVTKLSLHSSRMSAAYVTKDGSKLLYLTRFEKGYDLWQTNLRTKETKILCKLGSRRGGSIVPDAEDKNVFILSNGKIFKVDLESGEKKSINVNGEMVLNESAEREYIFDHIWRQVERKFYLEELHKVDWQFYKEAYEKTLPHINNNYDMAEMLSELLGELNASHTGAYFRENVETGDKTASLGIFYDLEHTGKGLKIAEIMDKSPLSKSKSKAKKGSVIEKIDGIEINSNTNIAKLLNRKAGDNTLLSFHDPSNGKRWDETTKPISIGQENELRYQRWVENCRNLVDELSGGKVGYVHVRGMNDRSFRTVYDEALGRNHEKESLIVDTRFNGGGWLHDDLATFLNGIDYLTFMPRGQNLGNEPQFKWTKPSAVVMSESNYSDAHMFPYVYKTLGIGQLIGMPVPGTGTAVWWENLQNGIVFGIPQVGMVDTEGDLLENKQLEPDIKVPNDPGKIIMGFDQQLEAAVKALLGAKKKKIP